MTDSVKPGPVNPGSVKPRQQVVIVDTGCANVSSVRFAIERLGQPVEITADPALIKAADKVILPGVGTAQNAMAQLKARNLVELLQQLTQPVLGICLGMQLQTNRSAEGLSAGGSEAVECLGQVDTEVLPLDSKGQRLPHMGWNTLRIEQPSPLLAGISDDDYVYFVHSFAVPVGAHTLASCEYGQRFSAVIQQGNFYGCQFHPERSATVGARILQNFLQLEGAV